VLVLDMIEILPPLGKYKYDTWGIIPVKCYIDNSMRLWSCIRNVNTCLFISSLHVRKSKNFKKKGNKLWKKMKGIYITFDAFDEWLEH
jgi:hypothetical protein